MPGGSGPGGFHNPVGVILSMWDGRRGTLRIEMADLSLGAITVRITVLLFITTGSLLPGGMPQPRALSRANEARQQNF